MMELSTVREFLSRYDGPPCTLMEICGSHTAAIARLGLPSLLSPSIRLLSGPGCPVCVTPSAYIDRLCELACTPGVCVVTFGDMLRVPGSEGNLQQSRAKGGQVRMVYAPFDLLSMAREEPDTLFIFAAVGFETTTPAYALLLQALLDEKIDNVKLLTALKTMPPVVDRLLGQGANIDGFLAPGHVCSVAGWDIFRPLAEKYQVPFAVAGFRGPELLVALYALVKSLGQGKVMNLYPAAVEESARPQTQAIIDRFFEPCEAVWRGLGPVPGSGRRLRAEFARFDAGSDQCREDRTANPGCCCGAVLTGKMRPVDCPLYGKACTPLDPKGACMVSEEGSCHQYWINQRE